MAIPLSQFISNRNSSPVAERSRIQAVTKLNQQEQDDLEKEREWLESDEYKALQLKLNEMKYSPVRIHRSPSALPQERVMRNARHAFETNRERQKRIDNTFVSIYGIDGSKFDPESDSAQFFFSKEKSDFLAKPEVQRAFKNNKQGAELQFYRQFIKQNNDRAVEEGRDKVFGIPAATAPNINSQINAYKQSILESLTTAEVTSENLRHNYSQSVTDAAVRDSQVSRSFVSPEAAEAKLKDPNWVAAQKQAPFQHGALKTDESGKTYLATPPSASALTPGFTGVGSDFATYMELVEPFGMIGGQVGKSIAKDVFGAGEGVQTLASIGGSILTDPGSLAGLASLAAKSPKIATGAKSLLVKSHGKPNARTPEQLKYALDHADEAPPSYRLTKTEMVEAGFSEEQAVAYARKLVGTDSDEPIQPSFLRQTEDGEFIFELSPTHSMKVTGVDSYVDVSVRMLGMDDRTGTAIKPMMKALFQSMADSMGIEADDLAQRVVRDIHEIPRGDKSGVAGQFIFTEKNPNAAIIGGILKYSKNTDLTKNGDGYITMLHELAHAIYPTIIAISKNTPGDRANIIDVIKQRTISKASQSAEGDFTAEQAAAIRNLSADDFQRLVAEARPPNEYLGQFNRTQGGQTEELWRQFSESWAEVFTKYLFDESRNAPIARYSDEVTNTLLAATGFLQRNLDQMAHRVRRDYPGIADDAGELAGFNGMRGIVGNILETGRPQAREARLNYRAPATEIAQYGDDTKNKLYNHTVSSWLLGDDMQDFGKMWRTAKATTDISELANPERFLDFQMTFSLNRVLNNPLGPNSHLFGILRDAQAIGTDTGLIQVADLDVDTPLQAKWAIESALADPRRKAESLWEMPSDIRANLDYVDTDGPSLAVNSAFRDSRGRPQVFLHGGKQWDTFDVEKTHGLNLLHGVGLYGSDSPSAASYLMHAYKVDPAQELRLRAYVIKAPASEVLHAQSIGDADPIAAKWYKALFSETGLKRIHERLRQDPLRTYVDPKSPSIRTGDLDELFGREVLDDINDELPNAIHYVLTAKVLEHGEVGRLSDADLLNAVFDDLQKITDKSDFDRLAERVLTSGDYGPEVKTFFGTGAEWSPGTAWSSLFAEASVIATYKGLQKYTKTSAGKQLYQVSDAQQKFIDKVLDDYKYITKETNEAPDIYRNDLDDIDNWFLLPYVYDATRALNRNGDLLARTELPPNVPQLEDGTSWGFGTMNHVLSELAINHTPATLIKSLTFDGTLSGIRADYGREVVKAGGVSYTYRNLIDDWNDIYTQSNISVLHTIGGQQVDGIPHTVPVLVGTPEKIQSNILYMATKQQPLEDIGALRGRQPVSPVDDTAVAFHQRKPKDPSEINPDDVTVEKTEFGNEYGNIFDNFNARSIRNANKLIDEKHVATPRKVARTSSDEANVEKLNVQASQDKGLVSNDGNNNGTNIVPGKNSDVNWGWTPMAPTALKKVLLAPTDGVLRTSDQITDQGYKEIYDELVPKLNEVLNSEEYSTAKKFKKEAKTRFNKQAAAIGYQAEKRYGADSGQAMRIMKAAQSKANQVTKAVEEDKGLFKRVDIHPLEAKALIAHGEKVLAEKALKQGKAAYGAHYSRETGEARLGIYSAQDFRKAVNKLLGLDYETNVKVLQTQLNKKDLTVEGIGVYDIAGSRKQSFSEVLTNSEAFMLKEAFGLEITRTDPVSLKRALWRLFSGIFNLSRLTMLTGDLSAIANQGLLLGGEFTKRRGWTNLANSVVGTITKGQFDNQMGNIYRDSDFAYLSNKTGIYIGDIDGGLTTREESFIANIFNSNEEFKTLAKKVPALKPFMAVGGKLFDGKYSPARVPTYVIKASQRFHTLYLNKMRYSALKDFNTQLVESGISDGAREQHLRRYADFLNKATGRGSFGKKADQWMPELNAILLAPRWMASRVQVPISVLSSIGTDVQTAYRTRNLSGETKYTAASIKANKVDPSVKLQKHYDFQVTKQISEDLVRSAAMFAGITTLLGFAGFKIHTDWRKGNFGQHEKGRVNIDLTAGMGSIYRFIFRSGYALATTESVSASGAKFPAVPGEFLSNFIRAKLSPMGSQAYTLATGREFTGAEVGAAERFVPGNMNVDNYVPLFAQTIYDAATQLNSSTSTAAIGAAAFAGTNISVYPDKEDYALETTGVEYEELYDYEQDYVDAMYYANSKFAPSKYIEHRAALATALHDYVEKVIALPDLSDSEKNSMIWQTKNKYEAELRGVRKYEYGEYAGADGDRNALEAKKDEYHELMNEVYSEENPIGPDRRDEIIKTFMDTLTPKERDYIEANRSLLPLPDSIFTLQKVALSSKSRAYYKNNDIPIPEKLKLGFYSVPAEYMETSEARDRLSADKRRGVPLLSDIAELNRQTAGVGSR